MHSCLLYDVWQTGLFNLWQPCDISDGGYDWSGPICTTPSPSLRCEHRLCIGVLGKREEWEWGGGKERDGKRSNEGEGRGGGRDGERKIVWRREEQRWREERSGETVQKNYREEKWGNRMGRRRRPSHTLMGARRLIRGSAVNNINHKRAVDLAANRTGGSCSATDTWQIYLQQTCPTPCPRVLLATWRMCPTWHVTCLNSRASTSLNCNRKVLFSCHIVKKQHTCATQYCPLASSTTYSRDYSKCV